MKSLYFKQVPHWADIKYLPIEKQEQFILIIDVAARNRDDVRKAQKAMSDCERNIASLQKQLEFWKNRLMYQKSVQDTTVHYLDYNDTDTPLDLESEMGWHELKEKEKEGRING